MARKVTKDGKDDNIRICVILEQKSKLVKYEERHYQTMRGVVGQALDLFYAQEQSSYYYV